MLDVELDYRDFQCCFVSAVWIGERTPERDDPPQIEAVPMPARSALPVRCEGYAELCLWLLWQDEARELMADIPAHDREDIRQELTLRNWQYAVSCEQQGKRLPNPERWLTKELRRIISRRSGMQTVAYASDDAAKAAKALRDEARAAEREAAYLQHMRAENAKQAEQVKPVPVLTVRWQ
jgi:hypothetical protein